MISINLTLFIEFILFLLFFIVARKYIWKPLLRTIKEREDYFQKKETEIESINQKTKEFREDYKRKIEQVQKALDLKIDNTIHDAYIQQRALIEKEQKKAHEQLILFRNELEKQFCMNNIEIKTHAEMLSEKIIQCLLQQKRIF
ncbi:MAG: hypothetical protein ACP5UA_09430 [Candidatus Hydrogenedens sp.]